MKNLILGLAMLAVLLATGAQAALVDRFCACLAARCAGDISFPDALAICQQELVSVDDALAACSLLSRLDRTVPACDRLRARVRRELRRCRRG